MNEEQYQNPLDIFNSSGNDSIKQMVYKYVTTVCEEQDSIIESTIRKIGGTEFEKITIDRDKDQYEKIRHAMWYSLQGELHCMCSYCGRKGYSYYKFCPNCGAKMGEEEKR